MTGMRLGEALNLERSDIDLTGGTLVIRNGKFGKSRQVPLHPSTAAALRDYDRNRARLLPTPTAANFLLSTVAPGCRTVEWNRPSAIWFVAPDCCHARPGVAPGCMI